MRLKMIEMRPSGTNSPTEQGQGCVFLERLYFDILLSPSSNRRFTQVRGELHRFWWSLRAMYMFLLVLVYPQVMLAQETNSAAAQPIYSVILEGGMVYDGLGNASRIADIGLSGNHVAAIGDLSGQRAGVRLNVEGLVVAPGFIDIHSHATSFSAEASGVVQRPLAENYLRQGVTTALGGQDGGSPYPIGEFLAYLEGQPPAINIGVFVGHGTLRRTVMGNVDRPPTAAEQEQMQAMVKQAMEDGAFGLSSGLEYAPGTYAETEELIPLAQVMAPYDGLYISHIRDEGGKLLESVAEVIRIAEEGGVAGQVTHHKVIGKHRWGRSAESLALIDAARARGVDVASDQYPYTASSTGLTILFPAWSLEGSQADLVQRLEDEEIRARVKADIVAHINAERGGDPATIVAANCSWNPDLNGKSLADMLADDGQLITVEGAAEVAMNLQAQGGCQGVFHSMSEEDVKRIMQHPWTMVSSDGGVPALNVGVPHPRNYGAFGRVLARYVREQQTLSLAEAIRKMTSLPASRLGLSNRGVLREGAVADITVFDSNTVTDQATFIEPHQYATGIVHVFVNGQRVLQDGEPTGIRSGVVLRKTP